MRPLADRVRAVLDHLLVPLGAGSRALMLRLLTRFGWWPVACGVAVTAYAVNRYKTWIVWMLLAWCAAAWAHAPNVPEEEPEQLVEEGEERPAEPAPDPLTGILWELIGDAPGVHLKTVVAHLHETGLDTACDRGAVRAALDRRGITVKGSVREADDRVNEGVHRDDLRAWEEARSPAPPGALSKMRSNPVATALTSDVAEPATAVATPATTVE